MTEKTDGSNWSIKVSLTSKCNMSCFYCKDSKVNPRAQPQLQEQDYFDILRAARETGIRKVQWTGGECSVIDLELYAAKANELGYTEQALTSNGLNLFPYLDRVISAGLKRANISLDSIHPQAFARITGSSHLEEVLKTIEKCSQSLDLTKLNMVLMKTNIGELGDFLNYVGTLGPKVILKLHELWRFEPSELYNREHVSYQEMMGAVNAFGDLIPLDKVTGNNPNIRYYQISGRDVKIGVSPVPVNWTCGGPSCKKIRVYSTGRTCEGKNLMGTNYEEKVNIIQGIISHRTSTSVKR